MLQKPLKRLVRLLLVLVIQTKEESMMLMEQKIITNRDINHSINKTILTQMTSSKLSLVERFSILEWLEDNKELDIISNNILNNQQHL